MKHRAARVTPLQALEDGLPQAEAGNWLGLAEHPAYWCLSEDLSGGQADPQLFGWLQFPPQDFSFAWLLQQVVPEQAVALTDFFRHPWDEEAVRSDIFALQDASGKPCRLRIKARKGRNQLGQPCLFGICQNVDSEASQLDQLRTAEALLIGSEAGTLSGSYLRNLATQEVRWSPGILALLGLTDEAVSPQSFQQLLWERFHPDELDRHRERYQLVQQQQAVPDFTCRLCLPDGTVRWVIHRISRYVDNDWMLASVRDITEERAAQHRIQALQERFQAFMDQLPMPAWIKDDQHRYLFANRSLIALYNRPLAEIQGKSDYEINPKPIADQFRENDQTIIEEERNLIVRETAQNPDGSPFHAMSYKFLIRDHEQGKYSGGIGVDINQIVAYEKSLQLKEAQLRDSEARYKGIFDTAFQFIGFLSAEGNLLEANQTALSFGGLNLDDIRGLPFWECQWWNYSKDTQRQLQQAIQRAARGEFVRYTVPVQGDQGQQIFIDFSISPVYNDRGEVIYLIPEGRDITEQTQVQAELEALNAKLEEKVLARTEALTFYSDGLERLQALSAQNFDQSTEAMQAYLQLGLNVLQADHALIAAKSDDALTVLAALGGEPLPAPDSRFAALGPAYDKVFDKQQTIVLTHEALQHCPFQLLATHELRSCFIAPLWLNGDELGMICFAYEQSEHSSWLKHKQQLLDLLAQSLGSVLGLLHSQEAFLASEARFRALVEYAPIGITLSPPGRSLIFANQTFSRMLGYSLEELLGMDWAALTFEEDLAANQAQYQELLAGKTEAVRFEKRYVHKQGHPVWCRLLVTRFWNDLEEELLILAMIEDITEEKAAQEEIKMRRMLAEEGEKAARMGTLIYHLPTGRLEYSNGALAVFGLDPARTSVDNINRQLEKTILPEDLQVIGDAMRADPTAALQQPVEFRIRRASGDIAWIRSLPGENLGAGRLIRTVQDITIEKKQERHILEANRELEQLVYSVSHDLRAPLRHVSGYAELVIDSAREKLSEEERLYMDNVITSSSRLGLLIDELLQYSRSRNHELVIAEVNLHDLVAQIMQLFSKDTRERNIQWQLDPLPTVPGDLAMLEKVFLNLLSNAVKFTGRQPEPQISITVQEQARCWQFAISDNGAGFDPRYQDKLFAVFQRLHRQREFEGTGIGLANVHRIITRHGGNIWAEGLPNQGATFYFTLPKQQ